MSNELKPSRPNDLKPPQAIRSSAISTDAKTQHQRAAEAVPWPKQPADTDQSRNG
jgi:hypothetical protein